MADEQGYLDELLSRLGLSGFALRTVEFLLARPLKIALIVVVAVFLTRVGSRAAARFVRGLQARAAGLIAGDRIDARTETLVGVLTKLLRIAVFAIAGAMILDVLGVNLAPIIAGAGIAGIAVGFGAQTLVRDLLAGIFIVGEDQYGVGDWVDVGPAAGTVEDVNLRVTRLRAVDGTVWFVPNGEIQRVGNSSLGWGRAVVDVLVPDTVDLDAARAAVDAEVAAFATDPAWVDVLDGDLENWGVLSASIAGATLRVVARTRAGEQAAVTRELRTRLAIAVRNAGRQKSPRAGAKRSTKPAANRARARRVPPEDG